MSELRQKTISELQRLLAEEREKLRKLRFDLAFKKLKNVSEIKKVKKNIARILTLLNIKNKELK